MNADSCPRCDGPISGIDTRGRGRHEIELIDGPRPLPEWLNEVLFQIGVEEVNR